MKTRYFAVTCGVFLVLAVSAVATHGQNAAVSDSSGTIASPLRWYSRSFPLASRVTREMVRKAVAANATVPMWSYSVTSPVDNNSYSGVMVGRSPFFHGARTTSVPAYIVPIKINMPDGGVFDPSAPDSACSPKGTAVVLTQQSPIMQSTPFSMGSTDVGSTQYIDAFQRGNFWTDVVTTGDSYHTMLSPVTLNAITVNVPAGSGLTCSLAQYNGCGNIGFIDNSWFDPYLQNTLIPSLAAQGVNAATFPMILLYNVWQVSSSSELQCFPPNGFFSYHNAYGYPPQTYSVDAYDTTGVLSNTGNVSVLSHEVGEWMDDPLGTNPTPAWGKVGQVTGCQSNLEVGDPLTGTLLPPVTMPNGFAYDLQELAFFSWFYRQSPSLGVNDWFSDNGTFSTDAGAVCS